MNFALILLLSSLSLWAKPLILVSYFDAFGKAPFNNSGTVGLELKKKFKDHPLVDVRFCPLNTVFYKSFHELENCYKALPEAPHLILSLGETGCQLKMEMLGRNLDKTLGPDNEGNEYTGSEIVPHAPFALGLRYPMARMYCALDPRTRKGVKVSNNAGSFVCNNLAYLMAYHYPETSFAFMHVPNHSCKNLPLLNKVVVKSLETMILKALQIGTAETLPTHKEELERLRSHNRSDKCLREFYGRTKGIDEKSFWPF